MAAVLVAEDDDPIRELVARILSRDGHEVTCARDGHEAISALTARRFDVLILDVVMPDANAFDVLAFMHQHIWTPTLILTSMSDDELGTLKAEGVVAIIKKPFLIETLRKGITACLNQEPQDFRGG